MGFSDVWNRTLVYFGIAEGCAVGHSAAVEPLVAARAVARRRREQGERASRAPA